MSDSQYLNGFAGNIAQHPQLGLVFLFAKARKLDGLGKFCDMCLQLDKLTVAEAMINHFVQSEINSDEDLNIPWFKLPSLHIISVPFDDSTPFDTSQERRCVIDHQKKSFCVLLISPKNNIDYFDAIEEIVSMTKDQHDVWHQGKTFLLKLAGQIRECISFYSRIIKIAKVCREVEILQRQIGDSDHSIPAEFENQIKTKIQKVLYSEGDDIGQEVEMLFRKYHYTNKIGVTREIELIDSNMNLARTGFISLETRFVDEILKIACGLLETEALKRGYTKPEPQSTEVRLWR